MREYTKHDIDLDFATNNGDPLYTCEIDGFTITARHDYDVGIDWVLPDDDITGYIIPDRWNNNPTKQIPTDFNEYLTRVQIIEHKKVILRALDYVGDSWLGFLRLHGFEYGYHCTDDFINESIHELNQREKWELLAECNGFYFGEASSQRENLFILLKKGGYGSIEGVIQNVEEWMDGETYYYTIDYKGDQIDSCGGFIGQDWLCEHIAEQLNYYAKLLHSKRIARIKSLIRNRVPLDKRTLDTITV